MKQDHIILLENLATATQAYRTLIAILTKMIAELTEQVTSLTAKLLTAHLDNAYLNRSEYCSSNAGTPADLNPPLDQNIYLKSGKSLTPMSIVHCTV